MQGRVRCPHCRSACQFLGPSIAIPPKQELARWSRLQEEVAQFRQDLAATDHKTATRKKHDLERRIRDLKSRPTSSERTRLVKKLEMELSGA